MNEKTLAAWQAFCEAFREQARNDFGWELCEEEMELTIEELTDNVNSLLDQGGY